MRSTIHAVLSLTFPVKGKPCYMLAALCGFLLFSQALSAQDSMKVRFYAKRAVICQFTYTYQFPAGDLADRFGGNSAVGAGVYYKGFNNWFGGIEGNYLFAGSIREKGIFDNITNDQGYAVDINGGLIPVNAQQRGFNLMLKAGKIIRLGQTNQNTGLMVSAGVGYLEHWIRLDNSTLGIAALQGDYRYGYDRLTGGFALNQFIGYQNLDRRKRINFFVGLEFYEAFTKSLRNYDYDLMGSNKTPRKDIFIGLRFGWLLPIYSNATANREFYFQ